MDKRTCVGSLLVRVRVSLTAGGLCKVMLPWMYMLLPIVGELTVIVGAETVAAIVTNSFEGVL